MSIPTVSTSTTTTTATNRTIGPVTTAAGGGAALSVILTWLIETFGHIQVPAEVQGSLAVVLVVLAGWLVKPAITVVQDVTGKHSAA